MKMFRSLVSVILAALIMFCLFGTNIGVHAEAALSTEQRNAIAMLNYITVLTQDINSSKNSRLYMEQAYSSLINNIYPNSVDSRTQSQLTGLLDTMENYRMVSVKRDRLQYIYEQNQAKAIRSAVPNPLGLLSAVHSISPAELIASVVYMAVDSATSYMSATAENELQFIKDGWALDDEEATVLHNSRKSTFNYMISMVRDNNLPGDLVLTESSVEDLVKWKNNENVTARIRLLESNQKTYQSYGGYWLILAQSYYDNDDYQKCLDAIQKYETLETRIFRRDYEYAKLLPLVITALSNVYSGDEYVDHAGPYAQKILDNTDHSDWALRYFAAQTFVDLYAKDNNVDYLQKAYNIALDNATFLVDEQRALNAKYLQPVQETPTPKDATSDEKKQISEYNKMLKETRKTELPPVSEALRLNCDLLLSLAKELKVSDSDAAQIDDILHPNNEALFLTQPLDSLYWAMLQDNVAYAEDGIEFGGTGIKIPASLVASDIAITVSVQEADAEQPDVFEDWKLESVARSSDNDMANIMAIFMSESAKKHIWKPDGKIMVTIKPSASTETATFQVEYKSVGTKKEWYDYLKVWEGHKNEWYDYLKVWDNSVEFERVDNQ